MSLDGHYNAAGQQRLGWTARLIREEGAASALREALRGAACQSHPELSEYILGVVEAGFREGRDVGMRLLERARTTYAPLCGGAGDRLFYGALEPTARLLGVCVALLLLGRPGQWRIQGLPLARAILPSLLVWGALLGAAWYWRRRAERAGRGGEGTLRDALRSQPWEPWILRASRLRTFGAGAALGLIIVSLAAQGRYALAAGFLLLVAGGAVLRRRRLGPITLGAICLLAGILVGWAGRWIDAGGLP